MSSGCDRSKLRGLTRGLMILLLITACQQRKTADEIIGTLLAELPMPEGAILVKQADGVEVGSEEGCVWSYDELLYGINKSGEEIVSFYRPWITSQGEYAERVNSTGTLLSMGFLRADGLSLNLSFGPNRGREIYRSDIEGAQSHFDTVYRITIVYAHPSTWEHCSVVELPTPQPQ